MFKNARALLTVRNYRNFYDFKCVSNITRRFADGMVLIDEDYIRENRKITAYLLAAFRYGREDLDVLGLTFRKDLISQTFQVKFPFC